MASFRSTNFMLWLKKTQKYLDHNHHLINIPVRSSSLSFLFQYSLDLNTSFPDPILTPVPNFRSDWRLSHLSHPCILVLHDYGGGFDSSKWYSAVLADLTHSRPTAILSLSRPGYLRTQPRCYTYQEEADALAELLQVFTIKQVGVFAVGAGVPVALSLASKYPTLVTGIVSVGGISHRYFPEKFTHALGLNLLSRDIPSNFISYLLHRNNPERYLTGAVKEEIRADPQVAKLVRQYASVVSHGSRRKMGAINDSYRLAKLDPHHTWSEVTCPLLCIHGQRNQIVSISHAHHLMDTVKSTNKTLLTFDEGWCLPLRNVSQASMKFFWQYVF